eukprot:4062975-Pyramimonas_sp.AAC.1
MTVRGALELHWIYIGMHWSASPDFGSYVWGNPGWTPLRFNIAPKYHGRPKGMAPRLIHVALDGSTAAP